MSDIATQRVLAGAKFLDGVHYNWAAKIDISKLEMYDGESCIVGQLYGSYEAGLSKLAITSTKAANYGFEDESYEVTYSQLTAAWKAYLTVKPGTYFGKVTSKKVKVYDAIRCGDRNYVVYTIDSRPDDPIMVGLTDFLASYEAEDAAKEWAVGQILKAKNSGRLFMYAGNKKVWRLTDASSYGSSYLSYVAVENENNNGKLVPMTTSTGRPLVGGIEPK